MNTTPERREAERERAVRVIAELEGRLDRRQRNHVAKLDAAIEALS